MSDHFSGPRALAGPAGDICDLYAFPSPERSGYLVMVLNVRPLAAPDTSFSDAIDYRLRVRPLEIDEDSRSFTFGPEDSELAFTCTFDAAQAAGNGARPVQNGSCIAPSGETADVRVDDEGGGRLEGLRVYAGLRSDPFFIDLPAYLESISTGRLAFKDPSPNWGNNFNVLSIVVEVDSGQLLGDSGGSLFAVVAETVVSGKVPVRLERFGRPEIKNVVMFMKQFDQVNRDLEIRDLYNLEDPFHMSGDYRGAYRARLNANLAAIDALDGKTDWPLGPDGDHPLTDLLLDDYMVVDVTKPFSEISCFEIERAVLQGRPHETCGGRSLNEDVMDLLYTLLINAEKGPRISDGVHEATQPASDVFPYLRPPNPLGPTSPEEVERFPAPPG
jgi:hypothetical protein